MDPHAFFETIYRAEAPWDIGAPQPSMLALLRDWPPAGPVLDAGCGTGDLSIALAGMGLDVLGIDFVGSAIGEARHRADVAAREARGSLDFQVRDALHPSSLAREFGAVVDSGFFHVLDPEQRQLFAGELAAVIRPGGRYYLHAFAVEFPIPNTPRLVSESELRGLFTPARGWRVRDVRTAEFHSRVAPPVAAIAACIERDRQPGA